MRTAKARAPTRPADDSRRYRGSRPLFRRGCPLKWWLSGSLKLASMDDTLSTLPDPDSFRWSMDGDTVKPWSQHTVVISGEDLGLIVARAEDWLESRVVMCAFREMEKLPSAPPSTQCTNSRGANCMVGLPNDNRLRWSSIRHSVCC